ncbi:MAG: tRNA (guanosine(37)-N1)-methyltransferase TrmD [Patescibacteria group bacterium]
MKFNIITIFPNFFESFKNEALISRAQKKDLVSINVHNLRDYADDARGTVDDRPYGGGAGMVLMFMPIYKAVKKIKSKIKGKKTKVIVFNPKGKKFTQEMARNWSKLDQLIMICGRYEGIDERVMSEIADEEISIGDYVLFGGEVPAMVVMEAVTRLIHGVLGNTESLEEESFKKLRNKEIKKLISKFPNFQISHKEYPHYTRPEVIALKNKKLRVPKVLLSGDHKKIEEWRQKKSG